MRVRGTRSGQILANAITDHPLNRSARVRPRHNLGPSERAGAVDALEAAYRSADVDRYAAWVHESDEGMRAEQASIRCRIADA